MRLRKRWTGLLMAAVLLAGLATGCGQQEETTTFSAALEGVPSTFDPAMTVSASEQTVALHLYENLLRLSNGKDGVEVTGALAQDWECVDNLDGTETYTFHLRSDAKWSDGKAVGAKDFVYAWQHLTDPGTNSPNASLLDMVTGYEEARKGDPDALGIKAVNDTTLQVDLSCRCPYFLRSICTIAATMPRRADLAGKKDIVSNGPYSWDGMADGVLNLKVSEHYYDTRRLGPDILKLYFCETAEEAKALLENGTVDFAGNLDDESLSAASGWTAEATSRVTMLVVNQMARQLSGYGILGAMSLSIDRTALTELPGGGPRIPAQGLIPHGIVVSDGREFREAEEPLIDNSDYEKNCADALALLQNRDMSGITGVSIVFEMEGINARVAGMIQRNWMEKLGLVSEIRGLSAEEMAETLRKGEFSAALISWRGDRNDASAYLDMWRSRSGGNIAQYNSNAFDMLMRVVAVSSSSEARDAYLADAELLLLDQGYAVPLYEDMRFYRLNPGYAGLVSDGLGAFRFEAVRKVAD